MLVAMVQALLHQNTGRDPRWAQKRPGPPKIAHRATRFPSPSGPLRQVDSDADIETGRCGAECLLNATWS